MKATGAQQTTMKATGAQQTTMKATGAQQTTMKATGSPQTTAKATVAATTAAGPIQPNSTVGNLENALSNSGCGTIKLCAAEPSGCNPSGDCSFLSARLASGSNYNFELAADSLGYIAASLTGTGSRQGGNDTTYVCANKNGTVTFIGAVLNNGVLTPQEQRVNNVKGSVNGSKIQCSFSATVDPTVTTRTTNVGLQISTGAFNAATGALGNPTAVLRSNTVNLANPGATVTNQLTSNSTNTTTTTTMSPTTNHAIVLQQSFLQAFLATVGVLYLALL
ncbi:putative ferric-chelate reductase 1 [Halichoeres trimaculatus]|uniref:putative ferric-chelate reductase 1 n=1 Tax=Halichoeres trimaculatus TaxID=147232 RepID=UPI003D9FAADB